MTVTDWLLDSDPAIRWQVMRDLTDAPADEVAAERAKVAATDPVATLNHDQVIRELERKTLEAQQSRAQAAKDLAARDEDIAKRRLELYTAQTAAAGAR